VGWLTFHNKTVEGIIEGRPVILVHDGKIDHLVFATSPDDNATELESSLRAAGCAGPGEVRFAVLENTGRVSVDSDGHDGVIPAKMS